MPGEPYSHIIVGAGSAGCTLANRLTEDAGARVLLLEAGGWDRDPMIHVPLAWGRMLLQRKHDWMYFSEPEAALDGRPIECARGKVIGGSSSINAMAYVRGHRGDYERWAASGLGAWSYAHVLPYFRRQESWEGGAGAFRGGDGPLSTRLTRFEDPLVEAFMAAGAAVGHPATDDYNGAQQEGFARLQSTIRDGRRCSAAVAYLRPALLRANLVVETGALASRIVLDHGRAVAVDYLKGGERRTAYAEREIILAGGVINSPHLLMLSGIGDPDALRGCGIEPVVPLAGVGRNLQDHISAAINWRRKSPGPLHAKLRADRIAVELARSYFFGQGLASDTFGGVTAFLKSGPAATLPDVQLLLNAAPINAGPWLPPFRAAYDDGYGCRAVLLRPESRGRLRLASSDPRAPVRIEQNFLATDRDRATLRAGLKMVQEIGRQAPMAPFHAADLAPGDGDLDAHVRATAITVHHPLGTCRMGRDEGAVVDSELRVRGVERLRVVDASVMPDLVGGNINAPVIMIAEKAADLLRGRTPPDPVNV